MPLPRSVPDALVELIAHRMQVLGQPLLIRVIDQLQELGAALGASPPAMPTT